MIFCFICVFLFFSFVTNFVSQGLVPSTFAAGPVCVWRPCRVEGGRSGVCGLGQCPHPWWWGWGPHVRWHSKRWRYGESSSLPQLLPRAGSPIRGFSAQLSQTSAGRGGLGNPSLSQCSWHLVLREVLWAPKSRSFQ